MLLAHGVRMGNTLRSGAGMMAEDLCLQPRVERQTLGVHSGSYRLTPNESQALLRFVGAALRSISLPAHAGGN